MLPYTNTIKGKIVVYTYLSLFIFVGVLIVLITRMRYDGLKENAETILRLEMSNVAEKLNQVNLEGVTIAKTLAQAQESSGLFGRRDRSIHLLEHVLEENPQFTGVYYCFEPNADGRDATYLQTPGARPESVDSTGRFLPTWVRSIDDPDSIRLTYALHLDSSLYYHGLKLRTISNFRDNYIPPDLEISKHYSPANDFQAFQNQHKYMITEPYLYDGKYMVEYSYPIIINGEFKGIAGIDRTLTSFQSEIHRLRQEWQEDIILVSRLGRVVASTLDTLATSQPFDNMEYADIIAPMFTRNQSDTAMIVRSEDPIDHRIYYFTGLKMDMGHWLVISRVSEDEMLAPIRSQIAVSMVLALIGLAALLPLLVWIANSISRPVKQAQRVAEEITSGQLDITMPPHSANTDTGRLIEALGIMAGSIRGMVEHEQLVAAISGRFMNAESDDIDEILVYALQAVGTFIGSDSAHLLQYNTEHEALIHTHKWEEDEVGDAFELHEQFGTNIIPSVFERLTKGEIVQVAEPSDLMSDGEQERKLMEEKGIKSFVMVPLIITTSFTGAILFQTTSRHKHWREKEVELLRVIGHVFLNALNRIQREREIDQLNKDLERKVDERTEQLRVANRELEAFSYSVSHDLRTPLRHIDGFTDLLRQRIEGTLDEKDKAYLEKISSASQHMGHLIDDLLLFSRMSRIDMVKTLFPIEGMINEIIQELAPDYKGRNIRFNVGALPPIFGDPSMIRMSLINLISNAIKFTNTRSTAEITVEGETVDGHTTIAVRDNGVGFDPTYGHKLFGVFERLHSQTEFEGTGIGLANVKRIILRHGGTVTATGEVDKGATFSFTIPAATEANNETAA